MWHKLSSHGLCNRTYKYDSVIHYKYSVDIYCKYVELFYFYSIKG